MKKTGYSKRIATLIAKYGEEGYKAKLKEWASKGGRAATNRLDHQTAERRREIAVMGHLAAEKAILRKHGIKV